jgi:hypothetical protein
MNLQIHQTKFEPYSKKIEQTSAAREEIAADVYETPSLSAGV